MLKDLSTPYAALSDGELLQVVYDKRSLTTEAAIALDIEMRKRKQAVA